VNRREQQSGDKGKMVNEEAKLHRIGRPSVRAVEEDGKEQDIGDANNRRFGEEQTRQKGDDQRRLEQGGDPGERLGEREAGGGDFRRRCLHSGALEGRRHCEHAREDQPGDENCNASHRMSYCLPTRANSAPCGSLPMMM
jgi:hypothetical protein